MLGARFRNLLPPMKRGMALKTILCIATLDTKGSELQYLKALIEKKGHAVLIMDVSSFGEPPFTPDIRAEQVAQAASSSINMACPVSCISCSTRLPKCRAEWAG